MKKIIILSLLLISLMIFGCNSNKESDTTINAFVGGSKAILLDFVENSPPNEVYDTNDPFSITLQVKNVGEHNIPSGKMISRVTGIDPAEYNLTQADFKKTLSEDLVGTELTPEGSTLNGQETIFEFNRLKHKGEVAGKVPFNIRGEVCYDYQTLAQTNLCYKPRTRTFQEVNEICKVSEQKQIENSGAPLQVTSIEESTAGSDSISFTFVVENVHDGVVFEKDVATNQCDLQNNNILNKVYINVDTGLPTKPICSGLSNGNSGSLKLYDNNGKYRRTVRCTQSIKDLSGQTVQKTLNVKLQYGYFEYVSKQLIVQHG